jgi:murein L,D-transpeptidase YcbB/YkuD
VEILFFFSLKKKRLKRIASPVRLSASCAGRYLQKSLLFLLQINYRTPVLYENNYFMKKNVFIVIIVLMLSLLSFYPYGKENLTVEAIPFAQAQTRTVSIDRAAIASFFKQYPSLKKYQPDVDAIYKKRKFKSIWYDSKGRIKFSNLLYTKVNLLEEEGLNSLFPYKDKFNGIFDEKSADELSQTDTEIMLSSVYVFYVQKVFYGMDAKKIQETGWFIPRKNFSYVNLLDSLLINPELLNRNENLVFSQYYKLRDVLKKYRQIEKEGGWNSVDSISQAEELKPNDSSKIISQIRHWLTINGDLKRDSKRNVYDDEMMAGVLNFKKRNGFKVNYTITYRHIRQMNTPFEERIKTIAINMERCRWIDPKLAEAHEYIIINIPSFKLIYKKNGKKELESNVFLGQIIFETVVFSANMSHIVFSPYWYIPKSIIESELKVQMDLDENYLAKHNIEWNNGNARQKPGKNNSLGLVKFVFPNSNDIYLHDTPARSLFNMEYRTFSHGCINVEKAKELAVLILKDDPDWPLDRINTAMNGVKETKCILKHKIPIHIGYFTAWVNDLGEICFYNDIYLRDDHLVELLLTDDSK